MEQRDARAPQHRPSASGGPSAVQDPRLPRPATGPSGGRERSGAGPADTERRAAGTATVYRAGRRPLPARVVAVLRRMPAPKLTGLGCGLLSTLALLAFAALDELLLDGAQTPYGVFFVLVAFCAGLWVRPYDLIAAPVALPIAFTLGAVPIEHGAGGFGGLVMGVFSVLALSAGWLYAGTLVCVFLALVRKVVLIARRRASRPATRPARPGSRLSLIHI